MVAGKVKSAMGLKNSPSNSKRPKTPPPPPSKPTLPSPSSGRRSDGKVSEKSTVFGRSFGIHFPRASAQVQPRPPDVSDLLRLVEELRNRESRLKTELIEQKLQKESVIILPVLESEIATKNYEILQLGRRVEDLEAENQRLVHERELAREKMEHEKREIEKKVGELEAEIEGLKLKLVEKERVASEEMLSLSSSLRFQGLIEVSGRSNLMKNLSSKKVGVRSSETTMNASCSSSVDSGKVAASSEAERERERPTPAYSRSNSVEELLETSVSVLSSIRSRIPRVPKPPPKRACSLASSSSSCSSSEELKYSATSSPSVLPPPPPRPPSKTVPPPPPPPLPSKAAPPSLPLPANGLNRVPTKVTRGPEVVEFYHSLMRRDSRRESGAGMTEHTAANARDLVGEIENRSSYLLAIKTDVETQGDFVRFLIKEVENAAFTDIEDTVSFVKWLDDELSYLVDERAVLKHFSWPEQKADALREAAFEYTDLRKLESEASSYRDDPRLSCGPAFKKMQSLLEKLEHGIYNLSRLRESATNKFKSCHIPVDWMLEAGFVSQIKLASVKLAMKYMKRVSAELEVVGSGAEEEELMVQGVRFAFRVHQFAGGFDAETMKTFQELREKASSCRIQWQNQQQQRLVCRATSC